MFIELKLKANNNNNNKSTECKSYPLFRSFHFFSFIRKLSFQTRVAKEHNF